MGDYRHGLALARDGFAPGLHKTVATAERQGRGPAPALDAESDGVTLPPPAADAPITKAVIAAAGSGTRFLPATKAIPKEMIPLIDQPIIQYVVEELAASGIRDVAFVSRWDKKVLEDHFDQHPTLEDSLATPGKERYLAAIRRPGELVNAVYLRQRGRYGNGTPALNAAPLMGDAPFVYAFGDDLVHAEVPFTRQLVERYRRTPGLIVGVQEVPRAEVPNYGMVETDSEGRVTRIVEKPAAAEVTSTLVGLRALHPAAERGGRPRRNPGRQGRRAVDGGRHPQLHAAWRRRLRPAPSRAGAGSPRGTRPAIWEALFHYAMQREDLKPHLERLARRLVGG